MKRIYFHIIMGFLVTSLAGCFFSSEKHDHDYSLGDLSAAQSYLKNYVDPQSGDIDYRGISEDNEFAKFLSSLGQIDESVYLPESLSKASIAKKAFWLNAFNTCFLKIVSEHVNEIDEITNHTYLFAEGCQIGSEHYSLNLILDLLVNRDNHLENDFGSVKNIFGITLGARGYPKLSRKPYTPDNVEDLLRSQEHLYFSDRTNWKILARGGANARAIISVGGISLPFDEDLNEFKFKNYIFSTIGLYLVANEIGAFNAAQQADRVSIRPLSTFDWALNRWDR